MTNVKSGYLMNGETPLYYHEWGSSDLPALLFITPLRAAAYYWAPVAERLSDRFHCIALNLRGHGDSGPMGLPHTDVALYVSDISVTIEKLGLDRPAVVAFAPLMVGAGVRFAAQHPEQLRALICVDGGLGLRPELAARVGERMAAMPREFSGWGEAVEFLRGGFAEAIKPLAEDRAPFVLRRNADGKIEWKWDQVLREEYMRDAPPPYLGTIPDDVWEAVKAPILFTAPTGGSPQLPASERERLTGYGDNSEWAEIPNTTHFLHEENPEGFMQALNPFLKRVFG